MFRCDDEVAGEHDLESSADGRTVDRDDDGKREVAAHDAAESSGNLVDRLSFTGGNRGKIHPRAEHAITCARDDDGAHLAVTTERVERVGERACRLEIDRVRRFLPVDDEDFDGAPSLPSDRHQLSDLHHLGRRPHRSRRGTKSVPAPPRPSGCRLSSSDRTPRR